MYLLGPGTERAAMRRVAQRVDQIEGYPRTHAADEPGRFRVGYTETAFAIWLHDATGPAQLHGVIALQVDGIAERLRNRQIDAGAGRRRLRDIIAARGWQARATLPDPGDAERQPWTRLAPRDGGAGSTDGVPIPEGDE